MIVPITHRWFLIWIGGEISSDEVFEIKTRSIDIFAVAVDEIHRHIEHIIGVAFIAKAIFKHEGQHARARRISVGPDMAAI